MRQRRAPSLFAASACLLAAWIAASATACNSGHGEEGCSEYCEHLLACPGLDTTEEQCLTACEADVETAEAKGCGDAYGDLLECYGHAEDLCDTALVDDECTVQKQAFDACVGSG